MGNFNKGKKFSGGGGGKKFGGRSFGSGRGGNRGFGHGRDREMHKAICSDCGKNCEVPFRPTGDKPVFCSDCFKNKSDDNSRNFRDGGNRDFGKRNFQPRFDDKRSFQNDAGSNAPNYKAQFEQLNVKLDKILKVLTPAASEETKETEAPKSKKFEKAPKKETDTTALKSAIAKTMDNKLTAKKDAGKKPVTKKTTVKKEVVAKKSVVKKKKG